VTGFEGLLAAIIIIEGVVLAVTLFFLYRVVAKLAERTDKLLTRIEPEMDDLAVGIRAIRRGVEVSSTELRATLAGIRATTDELNEMVRLQAEDVGHMIGRATAMAERQIDELDRALDDARDRLVDIGSDFDRTILGPARTVLAVAAGVKRAIGAIASTRSRAVVDDDEDESVPMRAPDPWSDPADVGSS
jgi:hypothetical protein